MFGAASKTAGGQRDLRLAWRSILRWYELIEGHSVGAGFIPPSCSSHTLQTQGVYPKHDGRTCVSTHLAQALHNRRKTPTRKPEPVVWVPAAFDAVSFLNSYPLARVTRQIRGAGDHPLLGSRGSAPGRCRAAPCPPEAPLVNIQSLSSKSLRPSASCRPCPDGRRWRWCFPHLF